MNDDVTRLRALELAKDVLPTGVPPQDILDTAKKFYDWLVTRP